MTAGTPFAEVIGDPVAHSLSPTIHRRWLAELGLPGDYRATRVRPDELADYLDRRRDDPDWRGCNVTMPLKEHILPLLDTVHRAVAEIGAVNTVRRDSSGRLHGRTTDVHGIWRALEGVAIEGRAVTIVGAGGAARSAAFALRRAGAASLHIAARRPEQAERLARDLFPLATIGGVTAGPPADLLVNASPLGMAGHDWPRLPLDLLAPDGTVFDMVYRPSVTALMAAAEQRGHRVIGGAPMLLHQAAEAFATLFDRAAPPDTFDRLAQEIVQ